VATFEAMMVEKEKLLMEWAEAVGWGKVSQSVAEAMACLIKA
jgi:hypothetical protein